MSSTYITNRWGTSIQNPQQLELIAALNELEKSDAEHPDCWLNTEDGWSISIFESGLAIFENIETGEGPWHMRSISKTIALELWQLLQANNIAALQNQPWEVGYGNT